MAQVITALNRQGHSVRTLVGSHGANGFIRQSHPVDLFKYRFGGVKLRMLVSFAAAQFYLFLSTWKQCRSWRPNVVYVNTVLPAGAIVAAAMCRVPVLVHMHEVSTGSPILFRILIRVVAWGANRVICVSHYVADNLPIRDARVAVIHNALPQQDRAAAKQIAIQRLNCAPNKPFTVMMACSLKWYKGIDSFIEAARRLYEVDIRFKLVVNCEPQELDQFFAFRELPRNLVLVRRPDSVFDHYRTAGLVVNLSHREAWIESFGLTLLEAMTCGIPVIAPQVGGCTELFQNGEGGWYIDSRDLDALCARISRLACDSKAWAKASTAASLSAAQFSDEHLASELHKEIQSFP